jgi:hypothetical protein
MHVILVIGPGRVHCQTFLGIISARLLTEASALTAVLTTFPMLEVIGPADGASLMAKMMERCGI